jgi:hypothetical protein
VLAAGEAVHCAAVGSALGAVYRSRAVAQAHALAPPLRAAICGGGGGGGNGGDEGGEEEDPWAPPRAPTQGGGGEGGQGAGQGAAERGGGPGGPAAAAVAPSLNAAQEAALAGVRGPLAVVQGPPGTGKVRAARVEARARRSLALSRSLRHTRGRPIDRPLKAIEGGLEATACWRRSLASWRVLLRACAIHSLRLQHHRPLRRHARHHRALRRHATILHQHRHTPPHDRPLPRAAGRRSHPTSPNPTNLGAGRRSPPSSRL